MDCDLARSRTLLSEAAGINVMLISCTYRESVCVVLITAWTFLHCPFQSPSPSPQPHVATLDHYMQHTMQFHIQSALSRNLSNFNCSIFRFRCALSTNVTSSIGTGEAAPSAAPFPFAAGEAGATGAASGAEASVASDITTYMRLMQCYAPAHGTIKELHNVLTMHHCSFTTIQPPGHSGGLF